MSYQTTFSRYEVKYMISEEEKKLILEYADGRIVLDDYGRTTIRNIYFDTDSFRLIRRSLEKPTYKEKLRVRSYKRLTPNEPAFVEIKKKYKSVVYKRRLLLPISQVMSAFEHDTPLPVKSQIGDEIQYFREYYAPLKPAVFLSYEREAYFSPDTDGLRVTFDENILYRTDDLSLESEAYGKRILPDGKVLMEIKTLGGMPLWLTEILTRLRIFKTSFSKYGNAYLDIISKTQAHKGEINNV